MNDASGGSASNTSSFSPDNSNLVQGTEAQSSEPSVEAQRPVAQQTELQEVPEDHDPQATTGHIGKYLWGLIPLLAIAGGLIFWQTSKGSEANAEAAPPRVTSVELQPVSSVTVEASSKFVGQLEAQQGVVLQAESQGRVTRIFSQSGQQVTAGTPIVQLSPDRSEAEYRSAQANVRAEVASRMNALAQLEVARANQVSADANLLLQQKEMERTQSLVEQDVLPRRELDMIQRDISAAQASLNASQRQVAAAQAMVDQADANIAAAQADAAAIEEDLNDFTVTAPIAGQVGDLSVKLGEYITSSSPLTTIVQNSVLDLELAIPIERRSELQLGLPVELLGLDGEQVVSTGSLRFIAPQADANSQMVQAEASFENPTGQLQDAQRVQARIIWNEKPGILIPTSAISRIGGANFVYVAVPNPEAETAEGEDLPRLIAEQRSVQLGDLQDNQYQVTEGLKPGEEIVVSGILNLRDGAAIALKQDTAQQ